MMDEVKVSSNAADTSMAEEVKNVAEPAVDTVAPKKPGRRASTEKKDTEKKTTTKKETAKPAAEKKRVVKADAKNEEEPKKAVAKKTSSKKETEEEKIILQFAGKEISTADVLNKAKAAFAAANEGVEIKSIELYVKPEDHAAYYVVNGSENGKIDL